MAHTPWTPRRQASGRAPASRRLNTPQMHYVPKMSLPRLLAEYVMPKSKQVTDTAVVPKPPDQPKPDKRPRQPPDAARFEGTSGNTPMSGENTPSGSNNTCSSPSSPRAKRESPRRKERVVKGGALSAVKHAFQMEALSEQPALSPVTAFTGAFAGNSSKGLALESPADPPPRLSARVTVEVETHQPPTLLGHMRPHKLGDLAAFAEQGEEEMHLSEYARRRAADAKQRADHEESSRISVKWSPGTPESFATQQDGDMAVNTHETKSNEAESMAQQEQAVSLPPLPKKGSEGTSSAPASAFAKRNLQPLELEIGTMTSTSNGMIPGHSNRSLVWTPNTTTLVDRKSSLQISATRGLRLGEWRYQLTASNTELHHSSCHRLGSGNYGHVVLATNKATGEKIAVKILKSSDQSILNEVKSFVKAEGCPYLVQFFGGFILEGKVHIGLELMNLGSLEQLKHRVEEASLKIPAALLACITRQMVYGLNYLHEQCRLHRDIKPGNVLHNSKGQVKLTDFGISASRGTGLVGEVANQGTKKYMAPDESQSMDSDVWSLGLVICELAMMRYPYDTASTAWEVIIDVQPEPRLSEDHPAALREFVELTLKKLPGRATTEFLKGHAFLWTPRSDPMEFSSWLENLPGCSEKYAGWQVEPVHRKRSMRDLNSDGGVREEDVEPSLA